MRAGDCKHFTGIQHERCTAGVRYLDVRDSSQPGPYSWPCLKLRPCTTTCGKFESVTADEEQAFQRESDRILAAVLADKCPECNADLLIAKSGGSCVKSCPTHGFVSRECRVLGEP